MSERRRPQAPTRSDYVMMTGRVEACMAPSPEAVADAWGVVEQGGDPVRLAEVCRLRADAFDGVGRERLIGAAEALDWVARFLAVLDGQRVEGVHVEH